MNNIEIGLVVLGASRFESIELDDNSSFANSKRAVVEQFYSSANGKIHSLDLFDHLIEPSDLIRTVEDFLRRTRSITDLIIYYCGHGILTKRDQLWLALRTTSSQKPTDTLNLLDLREQCDDEFNKRRVYLILDCCFAGAALRSMMSAGASKAISESVFSAFPEKGPTPRTGTVFLTAAPASKVAKSFRDESFTVFSDALARVLKKGVAGSGDFLSFREIFIEIEEVIKAERAGTAPLPEIHPRGKTANDIAGTKIFINNSDDKNDTATNWDDCIDRSSTDIGYLRTRAPFSRIARIRYAQLDWLNLRRTTDEDALKAFIRLAGETQEGKDAQERLDSLRWRRIRSITSTETIENELTGFQGTIFEKKAQNRLRYLALRMQIRNIFSDYLTRTGFFIFWGAVVTILISSWHVKVFSNESSFIGINANWFLQSSLLSASAFGLAIGCLRLNSFRAARFAGLYLLGSSVVAATGQLLVKLPAVFSQQKELLSYLFSTELSFLGGSLAVCVVGFPKPWMREHALPFFVVCFALVCARFLVFTIEGVADKFAMFTYTLPVLLISFLSSTIRWQVSMFVDATFVCVVWFAVFFTIRPLSDFGITVLDGNGESCFGIFAYPLVVSLPLIHFVRSNFSINRGV